MGGDQGGQPKTHNANTIPNQPGSQPGNDWGSDQDRRDQQDRDRQTRTNPRPGGSPEDGPMSDDEIGTTTGAGHEATPRY